MTNFLKVLIWLALIIFLFIIILFMDLIGELHNNLIFAPTREIYSSPKDEGISHEEVYINTPDGEKLHGYFLPAKEKTNKVVIYLHGNAQNVGDWYPAVLEVQKYVTVNFLLIDYRGYGKSTGKASLEGAIIDAQAMYKYLTDRGFKASDISLYGRSIGGAIALELAIREKVKGVVVQSSFTSLKDIAKYLYPWLPLVVVRNNVWNSKELIKKINCPVLISHGDKDEVVPVEHSYELFEAANEPKKLIILKGAAHNDISSYFNEEYFDLLEELFLN